jgi:hypothetical protein
MWGGQEDTTSFWKKLIANENFYSVFAQNTEFGTKQIQMRMLLSNRVIFFIWKEMKVLIESSKTVPIMTNGIIYVCLCMVISEYCHWMRRREGEEEQEEEEIEKKRQVT